MIGVIALAALLWGLGRVVGAPMGVRWAMVAAVWAGTVLLHLVLPPEAEFRQATGGDVRAWLALAVVAGLGFGYRAVLLRLRARSRPAAVAQVGAFSDTELDRYSRHILLREIGGPGQRALKDARVLVVGAGGLGSPLLLYLAASGVGHVTVIDGDAVENSNLQRQIIHTDARIGMNKALSAAVAMGALNPFIRVDALPRRLGADDGALVAAHDLILDGTDNFDTRYLVNRLAVAAGRPLIAAAITQWEGQIGLYGAGSACYACVFPTPPAPGLAPTCAEAGVAAPLPGVIGAMMGAEAVKHLTGAGRGLANRLVLHDALFAETRVIRTKRRDDCPVCGEQGRPQRG